MDRLYVVIALIICVGCQEGAKAQKPVTKSRVNSVAVKKKKGDTPQDFCDRYFPAEGAPTFESPTVDNPIELGAGWTWVNIWATWCKPCIEEMPRMVEWKSKIGFDVVFVSADDTRETVDTFRKSHPEIPESRWITGGLKEWTTSTGFDAGAPLPLHVFVDPQKRVRCVRAGGVSEHNLGSVERLVSVD